MAGVTPADVWRLYVKPSMDGRLIIRKKTVNRKSTKVLARNRAFAEAKPSAGCGHSQQNGTFYGGQYHTSWKKFVSCERANAQKLVGGPTSKYNAPGMTASQVI